MILIPIMVMIFLRIKSHYKGVARVLSTSNATLDTLPVNMYTVVLIDDIHRGTVEMVKYANALNTPWEAVHFNDDEAKTEKIQAKWRMRMGAANHELKVVDTPYRNISARIEEYVHELLAQKTDTMIHVVMGQIVMDTWWARALHSNTSVGIKLRLEQIDGVVVTDVSYPIHKEDVLHAPPNDVADFVIPEQMIDVDDVVPDLPPAKAH